MKVDIIEPEISQNRNQTIAGVPPYVKIYNTSIKIILILVVSFFIKPVESPAQWVIMKNDADSLVRLGSDYIYNMQYDSASSCFKKVMQIYPKHPAGYFLDAMVEWWRIWISHDKGKYDQLFLSKIEKVLQVCKMILDSNSTDLNALFFKGGSLGYRGRYYTIRSNWLSAASDAREGMKILLDCNEKAPGNHDIMLGTGIYNYFAQKFQESYPILAPIMAFLPKGDKEIGLLQLQASARYARYTATEAKVVLQQIYEQFEKDNAKCTEISQELFKKYPKNPYFHRMLGRCYVLGGIQDVAERLWRDILNRHIAKQPGYDPFMAREAMYYIAIYLMQRSDYNMALKYFYKCDEASRVLDQDPSGFMVKLNLNVAYIYDMQGRRDLAVLQYNKILKFRQIDNSHELARHYLSRPYGK
ncbi:MAG: hypothetical protein HW421_1411 [Ignavibacteria bacterium]|nr:hypothetical protein [Ignavibacteria bacterium]